MLTGKFLIALGAATILLLILEIVRYGLAKFIVKKFELGEIFEAQFISSFLINFVFVALLPAVLYAVLYPILPFTSYRAGFFIALFIFLVGTLPFHIRSYNELRLPASIVAFQLFWNLFTLLTVIGCITYFYRY